MKEKFTKEQITDWKTYERVRVLGLYNMFDPTAREATGLTEDRYAFVMENYSELEELIYNGKT